MVASIEFMEKYFPIYNKEYFDNSLPKPNFALIQSKTHLGQFVACRRYDMFGIPFGKSTINMSTFFQREEKDLQETLIHEMIHYYIHFNNIVDTSSHGHVWKSMADEINKKGGWHISRTSSVDGCEVNGDITENKPKSEITFMSFERGGIWHSFLVSSPNVDVFHKYLSTNFHNYIIGKVDRNQFPTYSICRKKIYADKKYPKDFVEKILPFVNITTKVGNV
ncbi:MAG: SprT-like domain-containing protein [Alphaproteobacteria bacterium]|nr:SprT-like domain-containing protein [Alphaproteobacteria bacterium]